MLNKNTIRLYFGECQNIDMRDIDLSRNQVSELYYEDIESRGIDPEDIIGVGVGPRTIIQIFNGRMLNGGSKMLFNSSYNKEQKNVFGCSNNPAYESAVRSMRVWNYDYFNSIYRTRLCRDDYDCKDDEYCLCSNGNRQPSWCPHSGRRCLPKSKYRQSNPPAICPHDIISKECIKKNLNFYNSRSNLLNGTHLSYKELGQLASLCSQENRRKFVEGFSQNKNDLLVYIVIILIIWILY